MLFGVFLNPFQLGNYGYNMAISNLALLTIWGLLLFDGVKEVILSKLLRKNNLKKAYPCRVYATRSRINNRSAFV
ncbi:hypothetical protein FACS1894199_06230 [Bacteroidia bacterium]|nr:hypothetical protein FACS1894199_06230 [Bacteroidia bacterium]